MSKENNRDKKQDTEDESSEKITSFTDLKTWQHGHDLVVSVYKITDNFPQREVYALTDQIHRSAVSITSNIAEGFGRFSYADRLHFYRMARGSMTELQNQLLIARDVGYLEKDSFNDLAQKLNTVAKLLQGLIRATDERVGVQDS